MTDFIAELVKQVKPSATIAVSMKAAELKRAGRDVISLGAGEPDFDTPAHIKQAAIDAIHAGQTKYTAVDGTPALKQAIIDKFARENKLNYGPQEILVSCGAKQSIFNLMCAVINPGDEVIVPAPYWVSYPDMALLAGGRAVVIACEAAQHFKLNAAQLDAAIGERSKLLVLNSPSNPTGMVYSREELLSLAEVIRKHPGLMVVTDDIYEHIYWGHENMHTLAELAPDLRDRLVVVNGVSKAYAMTGWRIGYAAGPQAVITAMRKIQSQSTSNPCSISQAAAVAALNGDQSCVDEMKAAFRSRHDYLVDALNQIPGFECLRGEGAFYAFPHVGALIRRIEGVDDDIQLSTWLLEQANVAVVPGTPFGSPDHVRLSFATSMDLLKESVARIQNAVASLG